MNISAKTEYACIAMIELAAQYAAGEPVRIRTIAETHGIPARFLVQILLQLKSAGLVVSTRGASGGYQLARAPREISLDEVMSVIDGRAVDAGGAAAHSPFTTALTEVWRQVHEAEQQVLQNVTLSDVLERAQEDADHMYYI